MSARMGCLNASWTIHPSLSIATTGSSRPIKIKGLGKTYELSNGCIFSYGPYIDSKKMEKCTSHVYGKYRTYMGLKKHIIRKCKLCGHKEEKE